MNEKKSYVAYSIPVPDSEKKIAKKMVEDFNGILKFLEEFERYMRVLLDHADVIPDDQDMSSLSSLMKKYEDRLKIKFNEFVKTLGACLKHFQVIRVDSKMRSIKDTIIDRSKKLRENLIDFLKIFNKMKDKNFIKDLKSSKPKILKVVNQLNDCIKKDLFNYIEQDILGKIKLSNQYFPLKL